MLHGVEHSSRKFNFVAFLCMLCCDVLCCVLCVLKLLISYRCILCAQCSDSYYSNYSWKERRHSNRWKSPNIEILRSYFLLNICLLYPHTTHSESNLTHRDSELDVVSESEQEQFVCMSSSKIYENVYVIRNAKHKNVFFYILFNTLYCMLFLKTYA